LEQVLEDNKSFLGLPLLVVAVIFLITYYPVLFKLVHDWDVDPNYSHGFFIPLMCGYMIWSKRKLLSGLQFEPNNWGLVLLVVGLIQLFLSWIGSEYFLQGTSMILVLWGLILYLGGSAFLKCLFVPIGYLIFMIPLPAIIWNRFAFPLSLMASKIAAQLMDALGITVLREGNILILPNITLQVAEACSGLRSLITMLALSAFLAYLVSLDKWAKWGLFLAAVPIALVCNIIRLTGTGVLARHFGAPVAQGFIHEFSGWLVFMLGLTMLVSLNQFLQRISGKSVGHV